MEKRKPETDQEPSQQSRMRLVHDELRNFVYFAQDLREEGLSWPAVLGILRIEIFPHRMYELGPDLEFGPAIWHWGHLFGGREIRRRDRP